MEKKTVIKKAFRASFPHTVPILAGFLFLGMSYGVYMRAEGFSFWYPMLMSMLIFAGSMEFVAVSILLGGFDPLQTFLLTLMINARHLFYGLSMLRRYRGHGKKELYLIFGMCDETFSINYTTEIPEGIDGGWFMTFVTVLNHFYWVMGATLGGLLGGILDVSTRGIEFVMTAMFVVIFLEQWRKEKSHKSGVIGLAVSLLCLLIFGREHFIIPSMVGILIALSGLRFYSRDRLNPVLERGADDGDDEKSRKLPFDTLDTGKRRERGEGKEEAI